MRAAKRSFFCHFVDFLIFPNRFRGTLIIVYWTLFLWILFINDQLSISVSAWKKIEIWLCIFIGWKGSSIVLPWRRCFVNCLVDIKTAKLLIWLPNPFLMLYMESKDCLSNENRVTTTTKYTFSYLSIVL